MARDRAVLVAIAQVLAARARRRRPGLRALRSRRRSRLRTPVRSPLLAASCEAATGASRWASAHCSQACQCASTCLRNSAQHRPARAASRLSRSARGVTASCPRPLVRRGSRAIPRNELVGAAAYENAVGTVPCVSIGVPDTGGLATLHEALSQRATAHGLGVGQDGQGFAHVVRHPPPFPTMSYAPTPPPTPVRLTRATCWALLAP